MHVKFFNNEGEVIREAKIATTALRTPSVISFGGKFFQLKQIAQALTTDKPQEFLVYHQCRGAFLSDIECIKGVEYRV